MSLFSSWAALSRRGPHKKREQQPTELRIATSGSFSIRASIETLKVEGVSTYTQPRVRAALLVPSTVTTVQFFGDGCKKPGPNTRSSCVHVLQMFTPAETHSILQDAKGIGTSMGWYARAPKRAPLDHRQLAECREQDPL